MKLSVRFLSLFFSFMFLFSLIAHADSASQIENPFEGVPLDELIAAKLMIEAEIAAREDEFKTVTVPIGKYAVGLDIPAGVYTITGAASGWLPSVVCVYDQNGNRLYRGQVSDGDKIGRLDLVFGQIVEIEIDQVIFSTYKGLGF